MNNYNPVMLHVKKIIDSVRCGFCDKYDGSRLRFQCGHSLCADCAKETDECLFCLTHTPTKNLPETDIPLTQRVKHASQLLQACQEAFNIDVFKKHFLAEQLKREKTIFPKCIQAESKYCNKRKTSIYMSPEKEIVQRFVFPGEDISNWQYTKMEKSYQNVHQWLENNEKDLKKKGNKRPLTDLNVNTLFTLNKSPFKKRADIIIDNALDNATNNDRKHLNKNYEKINKKKANKFDAKSMNSKKSMEFKKKIENTSKVKSKDSAMDKCESGIVIDHVVIDDSQSVLVESPVVIDDTPSQNVDKDKLALLAVLEAHQHSMNNESRLEQSEVVEYTSNFNKNCSNKLKNKIVIDESIGKSVSIPFYKKSLLLEPCMLCRDVINEEYENSKKKDISITIKNIAFTTTIKFSKCSANHTQMINKNNASTQTDYEEDNLKSFGDIISKVHQYKGNRKISSTKPVIKINDNIESNVLFTNELHENICQLNKNTPDLSHSNSHVIINESDSEIEDGSTLFVTADMHRSHCGSGDEINYGVLQEVNETKRCQPGREIPCLSTDSSDKENRNPNRPKNIKRKRGLKTKKKAVTKHFKIFM